MVKPSSRMKRNQLHDAFLTTRPQKTRKIISNDSFKHEGNWYCDCVSVYDSSALGSGSRRPNVTISSDLAIQQCLVKPSDTRSPKDKIIQCSERIFEFYYLCIIMETVCWIISSLTLFFCDQVPTACKACPCGYHFRKTLFSEAHSEPASNGT